MPAGLGHGGFRFCDEVGGHGAAWVAAGSHDGQSGGLGGSELAFQACCNLPPTKNIPLKSEVARMGTGHFQMMVEIESRWRGGMRVSRVGRTNQAMPQGTYDNKTRQSDYRRDCQCDTRRLLGLLLHGTDTEVGGI